MTKRHRLNFFMVDICVVDAYFESEDPDPTPEKKLGRIQPSRIKPNSSSYIKNFFLLKLKHSLYFSVCKSFCPSICLFVFIFVCLLFSLFVNNLAPINKHFVWDTYRIRI